MPRPAILRLARIKGALNSGLGEGRIQAIVLIRVERASALLSPSYDDGSSEQEVEVRFLTLYGLRRADPRGQPSAQPR